MKLTISISCITSLICFVIGQQSLRINNQVTQDDISVIVKVLDNQKWQKSNLKKEDRLELTYRDTVTVFDPEKFEETVTVTTFSIPVEVIEAKKTR